MKKLLLLGIFLGCLFSLRAQEGVADFLGNNKEEICYFAGELTTYGLATASFLVCMETGGASCPIALKLMECAENPACNGTVAIIAEKGCTYLLEATEDSIRVYGKSSKEKSEELKKTFDVLNTVSGMTWLMKYLQ